MSWVKHFRPSLLQNILQQFKSFFFVLAHFFCLDSLNPSLVHFYTVLTTTLEENAGALMNICTQHREQINGSGWDSCVVVTLSTLCQ